MTRKPSFAQGVDYDAEVETSEVVAVEQHDRMAVRLALGCHVHIRHANILAVERQGQVRAWIGVRTLLAGDASGLHIGWRRHFSAAALPESGGRQQDHEGEEHNEILHHDYQG